MSRSSAGCRWTRGAVMLAMGAGVPLLLWLSYCASYALWMTAYPFADHDLWATWFSVPCSGLVVVVLLELWGLLWLHRTREASHSS